MSMRVLKFIPTRIILCSCLAFLLYSNLTLNASDSATPVGLYRVKPAANLNRGELALLRMPIKQIWALPGDRVQFTPEGVYREGKLIPNSAPEPELPRVCPFGNYTVPAGMFLGMGTNDPDSWDARYVCFLPLSLIAGKVTPIWTQ